MLINLSFILSLIAPKYHEWVFIICLVHEIGFFFYIFINENKLEIIIKRQTHYIKTTSILYPKYCDANCKVLVEF